jgi:hypothetical protein
MNIVNVVQELQITIRNNDSRNTTIKWTKVLTMMRRGRQLGTLVPSNVGADEATPVRDKRALAKYIWALGMGISEANLAVAPRYNVE